MREEERVREQTRASWFVLGPKSHRARSPRFSPPSPRPSGALPSHLCFLTALPKQRIPAVSYTHLRAHETEADL
eukprot:3779688-Rhodomonas_salina.2